VNNSKEEKLKSWTRNSVFRKDCFYFEDRHECDPWKTYFKYSITL